MRGKNILNILFCGSLLITCSGCDWLYRMLDKEGAEEKELIGEIIPFEKNPTIEEVQVLLKIYGYSPGNPDGVLGLRTRDSIEKFQKSLGLKQTRFVDQETWQRLRFFVENGLVVEGKINIVLMQKCLLNAGFNIGKADGKLGKRTEEAIKEFQKSHDLKVDGKVGYKTLLALSQYLNGNDSLAEQ